MLSVVENVMDRPTFAASFFKPFLMLLFVPLLVLSFVILTPYTSRAESDDHVNLQFSPLELLASALQVGAEFKLGDSAWTIGPELLFKSRHGDDVFGLKLRGDYYFSGEAFTRSWYISPIYEYKNFAFNQGDSTGGTARARSITNSIGVRGGYHWYWRSFNMRLGGGFSLVKPKPYTITYSDGTRENYDGSTYNSAVAEYDIGWSF